MKELNNRQKELLKYLENNTDKYVSKIQICKDLPYCYPRHLENHNNEGNKSIAFKNISSDVRTLNDSEMEKIIIYSHKGYKLADKEEAIDYVKRRFKRDLKALKLDHKLNKKINNNNQLYFDDEDIKQIKTFIEASNVS